MTEKLDGRRAEFAAFVWDHAADEFQAKFDYRAPLSEAEVAFLGSLFTGKNLSSAETRTQEIAAAMRRSTRHLPLLLQMAGLTRNKILQDLKGYARNKNLRLSLSSPAAVFSTTKGAELGAAYLARQLIRVFAPAQGNARDVMLEVVSQATWPGYIRQERAKRMGHEAEYRLACLLRACRIPFEPEEKAENPLCRDVQIDGVSYDLVSPSSALPLVRVKSTVHTANIGQYGESKDDLEIREARTSIDEKSKSGETVLLAFVDGVGFESNRAGLDGVLTYADEFCQFRTLWKAVVIAAAKCGYGVSVALPEEQHQRFQAFCSQYGARIVPSPNVDALGAAWTAAGDGFLQVSKRRVD